MNTIRPIWLMPVLLFAVWAWADICLSAPRVDFELVTERGFPITGAQPWLRLFAEFEETGVTIRAARGSDREHVQETGTASRPAYRVVGVLTRNNRLRLPGTGEIAVGDRGRIDRWIQDLRDKGVPRQPGVELAFGLTDSELVAFHNRLSRSVDFPTHDARGGDVVRRLVQEIGLDFQVSPAARAAFKRNEPVADELQGLSHGTALAAVLRPLGLACAPRRRVQGTELYISTSSEAAEWWPVGWPPAGAPYKAAPSLFQKLPVEISNFSLRKALEAIQPRVKIPFLYDHNAIANFQVDIDSHLVSFPKKRTSYKRVLDTVLFEAGLRADLRTDDAGTPFLWITTIRK